jgi:hypothetical protein
MRPAGLDLAVFIHPHFDDRARFGGAVTLQHADPELPRGGDAAELPTIARGDRGDWVTLVAYPAYEDFMEFPIRIERLAGDVASADDLSNATWATVWERTTGPGNRESLVINVRSDVLRLEVRRLYVEGRINASAAYAPAAHLPFRVVD